jgi:ubiquinone/menaquinone biosynthesis C-methylase UbiE
MAVNNDFSGSSKYYGTLEFNQKSHNKKVNFYKKILKKYKAKSVLDLGCGNGLYLFPLKKANFDIEGLDISKKMLSEARKKSKSIKLYLQDMSKLKINRNYDSIICLNSSLVLLPNFKSIEKTIRKCSEHLNANGILLLDLPNHEIEIKNSNYEQTISTSKIKNGRIDAIYRDHKKGNKWITDWFGFVKKGKNFFHFREHYEELIYPVKKFENMLKKNNLNIVKLYGARDGKSFNPKSSTRRVYLCQKLNIKDSG